MADHPHTIDRWDDATGENLIEQIAAVGDYLVALATYRAAVKRVGQVPRSRCAIGRGSSSKAGRTSRLASVCAAQGRRHHHQVGKIGHDLVSKKHDGCRQDDGYRYCDNVNAVRWVGHSLEVATSFKWVLGAPGRGC